MLNWGILFFGAALLYNLRMEENLNLNKDADINQALKEFEMKFQAEQMAKPPETKEVSDVPKVVKLVMKLSGGAIKEEQQAEYVILGFVVVAILLSIYLFFWGVGSSSAKPLTDNQIQQIIKNQQGISTP